jgi:hypothetical protein
MHIGHIPNGTGNATTAYDGNVTPVDYNQVVAVLELLMDMGLFHN